LGLESALRLFEIALVFVRFDHVARFHLDEFGASDFYLINKSGVLPDGAIFAANYHRRAIFVFKNEKEERGDV
jgi:hypothetical protein